MANKIVNYKKIRTDIINGKKKCIYMKPKGTREYVKSKGEFVLLSVYAKRVAKIAAKKLVKNKNGKKKLRGREDKIPYGVKKNIVDNSIKNPFSLYEKNIVKDDNLSILKKKKGSNHGGSPARLTETFMKLAKSWHKPQNSQQSNGENEDNENDWKYGTNTTTGEMRKKRIGSSEWIPLNKNETKVFAFLEHVTKLDDGGFVTQQAGPTGTPNPDGSISKLPNATRTLLGTDVQADIGNKTSKGFERNNIIDSNSYRILSEPEQEELSENLKQLQKRLIERKGCNGFMC